MPNTDVLETLIDELFAELKVLIVEAYDEGHADGEREAEWEL